MNRHALGYLLAFGSAATGAVRFNVAVFARDAYQVPLEWLLALALVVGVVLSGGHVLVRDGVRGLLPLSGRWPQAFLYGVLMAWSSLSHFVALYYLNETVMISLAQIGLLMTIALAVWWLGERFTAAEWLATGLICCGVLLLKPWGGELRGTGLAIILSGALSGAVATIVAKRSITGNRPRVMLLWRNAVALLVVGGYAWQAVEFPTLTLEIATCALAIGILGPYLHGLLFLQALERIDAAKASLMGRVQPVIVFALSWGFLASVPSREELPAVGFVVVGVACLAMVRPKAVPAAPAPPSASPPPER